MTNAQAKYEQIVYKELLRNKVDSVTGRIIVAIARHESAKFNSTLFTIFKNPFGMTWPPKRKTTAIGHIIMSDHGNMRKFCKFKTTTSATTDFIYYMQARDIPFDIQTPEEFVKLLKKKRYFEASEIVYLRAIKRHLNELSI